MILRASDNERCVGAVDDDTAAIGEASPVVCQANLIPLRLHTLVDNMDDMGGSTRTENASVNIYNVFGDRKAFQMRYFFKRMSFDTLYVGFGRNRASLRNSYRRRNTGIIASVDRFGLIKYLHIHAI